jgi:Rieske Fe-S protein
MDTKHSAIVSPERREFLQKALAAGAVAFCGSMFGFSLSGCNNNNAMSDPVSALPAVSPVLDLGTDTALLPVGGAVKKNITGLNNGRDIIIIHLNATTFVAFTAICTHQGGEINLPSSAGANLICPVHGSQFRESDGSVALGPASLPLPKFTATYDQQKNTVTIS